MEIKIEIENREVKVGDGERVFAMVDLMIGEQKIETGSNPISSYSFWEDMNEASERALFRIKKNNPKQKFDFNLGTMGMTEKQKEDRFMDHLKATYPDANVEEIVGVLTQEIGKIEMSGPDDNHPNPFLKFPIDSQFVKMIVVSVVNELDKIKKH
jgi:hypothetical protein